MFGACFLLATIALLPAALSVYWVSVAAWLAPTLLTVGPVALLSYAAVRAVSWARKAARSGSLRRSEQGPSNVAPHVRLEGPGPIGWFPPSPPVEPGATRQRANGTLAAGPEQPGQPVG